ncbi:hypothetical protein [Pontibacillus litoralis]|uniref:hypothetical protein n=1 Tax=Pontibacillus litoralis TaxID=516703 RepID=UPI0012EBBCE9|nr:hypothetical protein [Pontibacillus litoralis]
MTKDKRDISYFKKIKQGIILRITLLQFLLRGLIATILVGTEVLIGLKSFTPRSFRGPLAEFMCEFLPLFLGTISSF